MPQLDNVLWKLVELKRITERGLGQGDFCVFSKKKIRFHPHLIHI